MAADEKPESEEQDTPQAQAKRWTTEFDAARKWMQDFHTQGQKVVKRFRDDRKGDPKAGPVRLNIFPSDMQTQRAMVYGKPPRVAASRRFNDALDDKARVAANIYERLLNTDIELDGDGFCSALKNALSDRQLPGLGIVKVRFEAEFQVVPETPAQVQMDPMTGQVRELAPAVPAHEAVVPGTEDAPVDYVHWRDFIYSPCRVFAEMRWAGTKAPMSRKDLVSRFGALGKLVPMNAKRGGLEKEDALGSHPWARADVWEIWSKEDRRVYWYVEGFDQILDAKDDPLGLRDFWPFAEPLLANPTTDNYLPTPDYYLVQDQYMLIDELEERIRLLSRSLRVAGVYDKTNEGLKRLVSEHAKNEMIAVDNWAALAEKGGLEGAIAWLPIQQVAAVLAQLRDMQAEQIAKTHQVSGMADVMRGQAATSGVTATERGIQASFGSVRMTALQDEFARFASDVQRIKAEIIGKHFSAETILERSNIAQTPDAMYAQQAVQLIKSGSDAFRIEVKPEAVNLTDFAAQRAERTEFLSAMSTYLTAAGPIAQQMPGSQPFLLQMLQWALAGLRGSSTIEGVLDQAIAQAQQAASNPQPQQPDPKQQAEQMKLLQLQMKGQQEQAKIDAELKADMLRTQVEVQADREREWNQAQANDWEKRQQDARQPNLSVLPKPFGAKS